MTVAESVAVTFAATVAELVAVMFPVTFAVMVAVTLVTVQASKLQHDVDAETNTDLTPKHAEHFPT